MAALTLAELQSLHAALVRARAGGARSVRDQNGEEVSYKSDREMSAAIADLEARIAAIQSGPSATVIRFNTSKGT